MPAFVKKMGGKWRVVDRQGILKNKAGTAVDGAGHGKREDAEAQARAVNAQQSK